MEQTPQNKLSGKTIVATRDEKGNARFAANIAQTGAIPIVLVTIEIKPLTHTGPFQTAVRGIAEYDWVIFTSANGVSIFADYMSGIGEGDAIFGGARVAAIGNGTAARLHDAQIKVDFVPEVFTSLGLGSGLAGIDDLRGKAVLLLRSNLGSAELTRLLVDAGARADDVAVYGVESTVGDAEALVEKLRAGKIDWLTFASPSAVRGFIKQVDLWQVKAGGVKIASIGPITSEQIRESGLQVDVEASTHTMDGLLAAIESAC